MPMRTELLKNLYVGVTGTETVTQSQEESPSHEPSGTSDIELERYVSAVAREDGLADAVRDGEHAVPPP